jgi:hypothetical protein
MIQYACDWCSRVKRPEQVWILGQAAEARGVTSARREVTILTAWDRELAVHPLAVHFCSLACKDKYMAHIFSPEATTETALGSVPGEQVVERIRPRKKVVTRTKARKSRPHRRAA